MNLKVILRNVGFALLVNALFMFFSILVSVANGNDSALAALLISFIMTFSVGVFPFIFVRKTSAISITRIKLILNCIVNCHTICLTEFINHCSLTSWIITPTTIYPNISCDTFNLFSS